MPNQDPTDKIFTGSIYEFSVSRPAPMRGPSDRIKQALEVMLPRIQEVTTSPVSSEVSAPNPDETFAGLMPETPEWVTELVTRRRGQVEPS